MKAKLRRRTLALILTAMLCLSPLSSLQAAAAEAGDIPTAEELAAEEIAAEAEETPEEEVISEETVAEIPAEEAIEENIDDEIAAEESAEEETADEVIDGEISEELPEEEIEDTVSENDLAEEELLGDPGENILTSARIPDKNLLAALKEVLHTDSMTAAEANNYIVPDNGWLSLTGRGIKDLTGLSYFSKVQKFDLSDNSILSLTNANEEWQFAEGAVKGLRLSNNQLNGELWMADYWSSLEELEIDGNSLTKLSLYIDALQLVICRDNELEFLNCDSDNLTTLVCSGNKLTDLDVKNCYSLQTLDCGGNELTTLTNLPTSLTYLNCSNNKLDTLQMTTLNNLTSLDASNNRISDVYGLNQATKLQVVYISNNEMTRLDLFYQSKLGYLDCSHNRLNSLTMPSSGNSLFGLDCSYNNLVELKYTAGSSLQQLDCSHNRLSSLQLNSYTQIEEKNLITEPQNAQTEMFAAGGGEEPEYIIVNTDPLVYGIRAGLYTGSFGLIDKNGESHTNGSFSVYSSMCALMIPMDYAVRKADGSLVLQIGSVTKYNNGASERVVYTEYPLKMQEISITSEEDYFALDYRYPAADPHNKATLHVAIEPEWVAELTAATGYMQVDLYADDDRPYVVNVDDSNYEETIISAEGIGTTGTTDIMAWIRVKVGSTWKSVYGTKLCRVDVMDALSENPREQGIGWPIICSLASDKASVKLFSEDYASIEYDLVNSLHFPVSSDVDSTLLTASLENNGGAVTEARFQSDELNQLFKLVVKDTSTLLIVPTEEALNNPGRVKGSYTETVILKIWTGGVSDPVNYSEQNVGKVALSINKGVPSVKGTVKLNSALSMTAKKIQYTGGEIESVADTSCDSSYLSDKVEIDNYRAQYIYYYGGLTGKGSGKFVVKAKLKGWAGIYEIPVTVSAAPVSAKISGAKTTVHAYSNAVTKLKIGDEYADHSMFPVLVDRIEEKVGGKTVTYSNGSVLTVTIEENSATGELEMKVYGGMESSKAHTYKVILSIDGIDQESVLTVSKPKYAAAKLTAKVVGAVDLALKRGSVTIKSTLKNYSNGDGKVFAMVERIENVQTGEDVTAKFDVERDGLNFTLRVKAGASMENGTYRVFYRATRNEMDPIAENDAKFTVKYSVKNAPIVKTTVKVSGKHDVSKTSSDVTLSLKTMNFGDSVQYDIRIVKTYDGELERTLEPFEQEPVAFASGIWSPSGVIESFNIGDSEMGELFRFTPDGSNIRITRKYSSDIHTTKSRYGIYVYAYDTDSHNELGSAFFKEIPQVEGNNKYQLSISKAEMRKLDGGYTVPFTVRAKVDKAVLVSDITLDEKFGKWFTVEPIGTGGAFELRWKYDYAGLYAPAGTAKLSLHLANGTTRAVNLKIAIRGENRAK